MKRTFSILTLFVITALVCASCVSVTVVPPVIPATLPPDAQLPATTVPSSTPEPATPTPEVFIPLTQAVPGQIEPTSTSPSTAGLTTTYGPLTLVVPSGIANGASGSEMPRVDSQEAAGWQKTPGHWQVSLGDYYILQGKSLQPQIYVYPAQGYVELVPGAFESIRRLVNILYGTGGPSLGAGQLPTVPFFNAQQVFTSKPELISFQNGSGVRFLTEYAQYPASANNQDLFYNFQGVTRDGAYYIVAIFPITVPVLAETSDAGAPLPSGGVPYPYMADPNADMKAYYTAVTGLLNTTTPDAFTPTIGQLDLLIQSMRVAP